MIPAQFDYIVAKSLDEAVKLLGQHPDEAKVLAGGHSLIPAMKLRLAQPATLIDIARIKDLAYIRESGEVISIGATTTHHQIESSDLLKKICPLLAVTASHIGDVQVRNKGTIGGSVAHADPAADWPAAMIALGAEMTAVGGKGERVIIADVFFVDMLTSALEPGELLREIRIQVPTGKFGQAYKKVPHPASGFAVVGVAVSLTLDGGGKIASAGIGITGVASKAYRASAVEKALVGNGVDQAKAAAAHATDGIDANGDLFASAKYRRHLAEVYTARAIESAAAAAR